MIALWTTPQTTPSPSNPVRHSCRARSDSTTSAPEARSRIGSYGVTAVLFILSLVFFPTVAAAEWKPAPSPSNCPAGYRCLTIEDYTHMTAVKAALEEDLKAERRKRKHFGIGATLGPSLGLVVDEELHTKIVPSAASIAVGLTIKF